MEDGALAPGAPFVCRGWRCGGASPARRARRWVKGCRRRWRFNNGFGVLLVRGGVAPLPPAARGVNPFLKRIVGGWGERAARPLCAGGCGTGRGALSGGRCPPAPHGRWWGGLRGPRCGWAWGRCQSLGRGAVPPARAHEQPRWLFLARGRGEEARRRHPLLRARF